jgi:2-polyprenyl-6-methoxyphenol hydroxylase-like FAD-dependent oxidoreductase
MRVIVIGSGIGGLCCALGLRKVGIEVSVYERAPEIREVGAGIMLWANALRALIALDAWDNVRSVVMPTKQIQLATNRGHKIQFTASSEDMEKQIDFCPAVGFAHRAELVGCLASLLPAGTIRCGFECVSAGELDNRVKVNFSNGHSDHADIVVGADGINSRIRQHLLGNNKPRYAGYTCWRGIGPRPREFAPGEVRLWTGPGSQVGLNSMLGDRVYWFATKNALAGEHSDNEYETVQRMFSNWASPLPEMLASTEPSKVIRGDIIDRAPNRPWVKGRCVLIGDAAHSTTPNFGQGGGMAIEDAVVLARALTKNSSDPQIALKAFEEERYKRTSTVTNEAWSFGKTLQWEGAFNTWLRDQMSGVLLRMTGSANLIKHGKFDVGELPASESRP